MADTSIAELLLPLTLFLTADSCAEGNSTAVQTTGTLCTRLMILQTTLDMEKKDLFLIIIAFLGWSWGIVLFIINRRNHNKDKLTDRKYDAYSAYMKKADEIMNIVRTDPNMFMGITSDFLRTAMTGDEEKINSALIQMNEELIEYSKKATEPLLILRQELNSLLIICSSELAIKIEELNYLTTDFNNEMQKTLSLISPNDSNEMIRQLQTLGHNERWSRFENLNKEIIAQMRKELGYK